MFIIASLLLLGGRIALGRAASIFFAPEYWYDDALMVRYADFYTHYISQSMPYSDLIVKDMGYPVFLHVIGAIGIKYTDAMALLWFGAAVCFTYVFCKITKIRHILLKLSIYAIVLFNPSAFEVVTGTRLYRNALLTPLYFIFLSMLVYSVYVYFYKGAGVSLRRMIAFQLVLGLLFTWTFFVKEDGIWLLACLIATTLLCVIGLTFAVKYDLRRRVLAGLCLLIPFVVFFGGDFFYKEVNMNYFGVREINNRTEGELGRFVKLVYKIKSDERTGQYWAPTDAVNKAFDASYTLQSNQALRDKVMHEAFVFGDISMHPINGDFLGWVFLNALRDSGTCHSVAEQEAYLGRVNKEIEEAFKRGTLERENKFQLVSSMGGDH